MNTFLLELCRQFLKSSASTAQRQTQAPTKMNRFTLTILGLAALPTAALAQTASPAVGFNKVTCLGNSDTICSVPFDQKPDFVGVLSGAPSVVADAATLTVSPSPSWTVNQFGATHFVRFISGSKNGFWYQITANTANTITIALNGDSLSGVAANEQFRVVKFWTFSTLFPSGAGVHTTTVLSARQTEVFIPSEADGINKAPTATFFYFTNASGTFWRKAGSPINTNFNEERLMPNSAFIVRHNIATDTILCISGRVPIDKQAVQLDIASIRNDNWRAFDRPIPLTLNQLGLHPGSFAESPSVSNQTDLLFVFNNSIAQKNKAPSATYFYLNNGVQIGWRKAGSPITQNFGDTVVYNPGDAIIVRKAAGSPSTLFSINSPTY